MKTSVISFTLVLFLLLLPLGVLAQERSQLEEDYEEYREDIVEMLEVFREFKEERKIFENMGGGPRFGYFLPSLTSVNDRLKNIGEGFSDLTGGFLMGGTSRYTIISDPNIQVGFYGGGGGFSSRGVLKDDPYNDSDNDGDPENDSGDKDKFITEASVGMGLFQFVSQYKLPLGDMFAVYVGAGAGGVFAGYSEDTDYRGLGKPRRDYGWGGVGFSATGFGGGQVRFGKIFAIGADVGYLYAELPKSSLQPGAGTPEGNSPVDLNLSGLFIRVGPQFNF